MLWKFCTQYAIKFRKLISGHRTGKGQFSFQCRRKAIPKNVQTTTQLHSSHRLAKQCSKFSNLSFNSTLNWELPVVQAGFRKGRGTRDQIANIHWITEKAREFQNIIYFLLYWLCQSLWLCRSQKSVENSSRDRNIRPPYLPPEKSVCRSRSNS